MAAAKKRLPDGTVIVQCPVCNAWRKDAAFFIGTNRKDPTHWVPKCSSCRGDEKEHALVHELGKPRKAGWDDKAKECRCGDGNYTVFNEAGQPIVLGRCFRCKGKAFQTWRDRLRNMRHDLEANKRLEADAVKEVEECEQKAPEPQEGEVTPEQALEEFDSNYIMDM